MFHSIVYITHSTWLPIQISFLRPAFHFLLCYQQHKPQSSTTHTTGLNTRVDLSRSVEKKGESAKRNEYVLRHCDSHQHEKYTEFFSHKISSFLLAPQSNTLSIFVFIVLPVLFILYICRKKQLLHMYVVESTAHTLFSSFHCTASVFMTVCGFCWCCNEGRCSFLCVHRYHPFQTISSWWSSSASFSFPFFIHIMQCNRTYMPEAPAFRRYTRNAN